MKKSTILGLLITTSFTLASELIILQPAQATQSYEIQENALLKDDRTKPLRPSTVHNGGGLCLDSDVHTMHQNGGIVHVWECNGTQPQRWYDYGTAITNSAGLCLDSDVHTMHQNGGIVHVWECNGTPQQTWTVRDSQIRNGAGLCLDSDVNTMHQSGGIVHVWECNGTPQQSWRL